MNVLLRAYNVIIFIRPLYLIEPFYNGIQNTQVWQNLIPSSL